MPNIGPLELAIVAIIALIIFGPKRLPELGRSIGDGLREFKSSVSGENRDDEDEDDDDEPDEVEATLDEILKERLVVADEEEEDEDEVPDTEDKAEAGAKVLPKQPDEFVCQSCFLVKHPSQLADAKRKLCADCV